MEVDNFYLVIQSALISTKPKNIERHKPLSTKKYWHETNQINIYLEVQMFNALYIYEDLHIRFTYI